MSTDQRFDCPELGFYNMTDAEMVASLQADAAKGDAYAAACLRARGIKPEGRACEAPRAEPVEPGPKDAPNNRSTPWAAPTGEALTDEQIERHTILASQCPPDSRVLLVSSVRRLRAALATHPPAVQPVAPAVPDAWLYEWLGNNGDGPTRWHRKADLYEPMPSPRVRNVRPLVLAATPSAEAQPTPNEPARYRLLQRTDLIEPADEFLAEDGETWAVDPGGLFVGTSYAPAVLRPARRPLRATPKEN